MDQRITLTKMPHGVVLSFGIFDDPNCEWTSRLTTSGLTLTTSFSLRIIQLRSFHFVLFHRLLFIANCLYISYCLRQECVSLVGSLKLQSDDSPRPRPRTASTTINGQRFTMPSLYTYILINRKRRSGTDNFIPSRTSPKRRLVSAPSRKWRE